MCLFLSRFCCYQHDTLIHISHSCNTLQCQCTVTFFPVRVQPMDLSWNPFSRGGLFMSAPSLVEKLRGQQCPFSRQFLRALSLCHTVMAEWKEGCVCVRVSTFWGIQIKVVQFSPSIWEKSWSLDNTGLLFHEISVWFMFPLCFVLHWLTWWGCYNGESQITRICTFRHYLSNVDKTWKDDAIYILYLYYIFQPLYHWCDLIQ